MGRFGRRRAVLEDISARLRHGAAALKAAAARDNAFFKEVVSLQRFWKVSRAPGLLLSLIGTQLMIDNQDRLRGLGEWGAIRGRWRRAGICPFQVPPFYTRPFYPPLQIRVNPLVAEYADSPFSVDISLMEGASQHQHSGNLEDVQQHASTSATSGAAPRWLVL